MRQQFIGLLYGWIVILGMVLTTSFILALLLRFSSFNDPALSWVTLVIGLITLFIGGIIAGVKAKKKGWVIGAVTGAGFTLFTFFTAIPRLSSWILHGTITAAPWLYFCCADWRGHWCECHCQRTRIMIEKRRGLKASSFLVLVLILFTPLFLLLGLLNDHM
ncbi:TIGR04086 family membrane protein [Virgibacillus halophilus]|uniref:TIGR04086 family membrane protein n=1 Tax=Tigheibacillus halophilus TaxID=361280 RepID=A0ABU5CCX7_9BACI|nr:TIGR04086 family membrane protein [Virgibacillus halophilus]